MPIFLAFMRDMRSSLSSGFRSRRLSGYAKNLHQPSAPPVRAQNGIGLPLRRIRIAAIYPAIREIRNLRDKTIVLNQFTLPPAHDPQTEQSAAD